jgi:hypothetical protein
VCVCVCVCVWWVLLGGERVNEGDKVDRIWLMDFIHLYEVEQ